MSNAIESAEMCVGLARHTADVASRWAAQSATLYGEEHPVARAAAMQSLRAGTRADAMAELLQFVRDADRPA